MHAPTALHPPIDDGWLLLDRPEHLAEFTQEQDTAAGKQVTAAFIVEGMHCAACARNIETAVGALPGVLRCDVSYAAQRVRVTYYGEKLRASHIAHAITQAGYRALPVRSLTAENMRAKEHRMALWRLLVAGFCMMQIMMYTTPLYLAAPGEIESDIAGLMHWASWMLCLPVLLFSARPFFAAAWSDMRHARIGMDTPVALGIALAFAAGTVAVTQPNGPLGGESYFDAISMLVFFLLAGRFFEQKARNKTLGLIDGIVQRIPETVDRFDLPTQTYVAVSAKELMPGDMVRVRAGQAFAGDGEVLEGPVFANEALLTGESTPVKHGTGETVLAGSINLSGPVRIRITALAKSTRFAQIAQLVEQAAAQKPQWAQLADRLAAPLLIAVLLLALISAALWWWFAPELAPHMPLKVALTVLIVTCPCALALAMPSALLATTGRLANHGILLRRLSALELLTRVRTFVFDKTGTLTDGTLELVNVAALTGVDPQAALSTAMALAEASLHPVSRALTHAAKQRGTPPDTGITRISESPGAGITAEGLHGDRYKLGSAAFCAVQEQDLSALTGTQCYLTQNGSLLARFEFAEHLREGVRESVQALREGGGRAGILSGDSEAATQQLAQAIGADFAIGNNTPEQKLSVLRQEQAAQGRVAVIGDGINDAPVLAQADVSFTLGEATPLAQQTADFIILSNKLSDVVYAQALAKQTMRIVRQNLVWAAAYNLICVPLAALGKLPPWLAALGMAASSLLVVANSLRLVRSKESLP